MARMLRFISSSLLLLSFLAAIAGYTQSAIEDEIQTLPYSEPFHSKQFSGRLQISTSKFIHYMYFESENDPVADSIVFWTNGGPGCSGLLGLFTEMGPWRPMADGSLKYNPASWATKANMVYLEQPAGVGFSYTTNNDELYTNDYQAASDNLATLHAFFNRFPERRNNTLYLASESYGGHYMPTLTLSVLSDPILNENLGGFLVGNPFVSWASLDIGLVNAMWGLQVVDYNSWTAFASQNCQSFENNGYLFSDSCYRLYGTLYGEAANLNPYALNFPVCASSSGYSAKGTLGEEGEDIYKSKSRSLPAGHAGFNSGSGQVRMLLKKRDSVHREMMILSQTQTHTQTQTPTQSLSPNKGAATDSSSGDLLGLSTIMMDPFSRKETSGDLMRHNENNMKNKQNPKKELSGAEISSSSSSEDTNHEDDVIDVQVAPVTISSRSKTAAINSQNKDVKDSRTSTDTAATAMSSTPATEGRANPTAGGSATTGTMAGREGEVPAAVDGGGAAGGGVGLPYDPCTEDYTVAYLNRHDVQTALHVLRDNTPITWGVCSDPINGQWANMDWNADVKHLYGEIYRSKKRREGFKMLVFSGDSDGVCATMGTQSWIYSVTGITAHKNATDTTSLPAHVESLWQPWTVNITGQQGGYLTKFSDGFTFATVHYAGHEVPAYQPDAALDLFSGFLDGSIFSFPNQLLDTSSSPVVNDSSYPWALSVGLSVGLLGALAVGLITYQEVEKTHNRTEYVNPST